MFIVISDNLFHYTTKTFIMSMATGHMGHMTMTYCKT